MDTNTETLRSSGPSLLQWSIPQQPGTSSCLLCTAQKNVCRRSLQESSLKLQSSGRIKLNLLVFTNTGQSEEEGIALPLNPARRETLHPFYLNFVFFFKTSCLCYLLVITGFMWDKCFFFSQLLIMYTFILSFP